MAPKMGRTVKLSDARRKQLEAARAAKKPIACPLADEEVHLNEENQRKKIS